MEETTGAPSSFAGYEPRRPRASSRDGGGVVNRPPSTLTMLLSRHTRRHEFIALLGGATVAWPLAARAQQPTLPVVGFLGGNSPDLYADLLRAFRQGLKETGYVEGQNLVIEYRWAEGHNDRLSAFATDLVRRQVAVIVATTTPSVLAAKELRFGYPCWRPSPVSRNASAVRPRSRCSRSLIRTTDRLPNDQGPLDLQPLPVAC